MITRTASELAELCGAALEGDGALVLVGPASLEDATADEVSFVDGPRYLPLLETTRAGCVVVGPDVELSRPGPTLLRCEDPGRAFSRVIAEFRPSAETLAPGRHPSAVVADGAELADDVRVGAGAVVGPGCVLAEGVRVHAGVVVGRDCQVGARTELRPGVVLYERTQLGADCLVHAGAVLGSDGFGFDHDGTRWEKIPQCGHVLVEDEVEIGANVTIDRGRFGATRICRGAKIDNLVHVAHNVVVGPQALLVAQVGVAGSSRVGAGAILAGQVGVSGHLTIGDGARVGGASKVFQDLEGGVEYWGYPPLEKRRQIRSVREFARLPELARRVRELERRLEHLEGRGDL